MLTRRKFLRTGGLATTCLAVGEWNVATAANQSENAAVALAFTTQPYLQQLTPNEVTVMWVTSNALSTSWVEYGEGSSLASVAKQTMYGLNQANQRINRVVLKNLKPGTAYSYRACSQEITLYEAYSVQFGATIRSLTFTFTTPALSENNISALIFNDIHEGGPEKIQRLIGLSGVSTYDFVFFNGDIINYTNGESNIISKYIVPCTTAFASRKPMMVVRGNHETRGSFARNFFDYFQVGQDNKGYYTFVRGPVFFIVLDSGEDKSDSDQEYFGLVSFDAYREEQAVWLQAQMETEAYRQALYKVVLMHIPPYESGEGHGTTHCRQVFTPLFNQYKIDMVISGHTHKYGIHPPTADHPYPIIIGGGTGTSSTTDIGNTTVIKFEADLQKLDVEIIDYNGRSVGFYGIAAADDGSASEDSIVLYRLGNGSKDLNTTDGYPIFLDEYLLSGGNIQQVRSIPMPTTLSGNNRRCVGIGAALQMGFLSRSADGRFLLVGGYNGSTQDGDKSWGKDAAVVNRVIGIVDTNGNVDTSTVLNNVYNTKDIRSVVSTDGTDIWVSGNGGEQYKGGVYYLTRGSTSANILLNATDRDTRNLLLYNGQLYVGTDTVIKKSGDPLPKTANQTLTNVTPTAPIADGLEFCIVDMTPGDPGKNLLLYWASPSEGIRKYSWVNNQWKSNGVSAFQNVRSLVAKMENGVVKMYLVCSDNTATGDGRLYLFEDWGGFDATIKGYSKLLLDLSGTRSTLRSVAWAPLKESSAIHSVQTDSVQDKVFVRNSVVCVETQHLSTVEIYNVSGAKLKTLQVNPGVTEIHNLAKEQIYLIRIGEEMYKVFP